MDRSQMARFKPRMLVCVTALSGLAFCMTVAAGSARAQTTLFDLATGDDIQSGDMSLTFENFTIDITGDLVTNPALDGQASLADYAVQILEDGWGFTGPANAADGGAGSISLSYTVRAVAGSAVTGASLFSNVNALGIGASASVSENFFADGSPLSESLFVFATGTVLPANSDYTDLMGWLELQVVEVLALQTDGGVIASATAVETRYTIVPEPETLPLMAIGLIGLALIGGPRRRKPPEVRPARDPRSRPRGPREPRPRPGSSGPRRGAGKDKAAA